jgi:hypothetical protein
MLWSALTGSSAISVFDKFKNVSTFGWARKLQIVYQMRKKKTVLNWFAVWVHNLNPYIDIIFGDVTAQIEMLQGRGHALVEDKSMPYLSHAFSR